jgi:diacylglycerol kinase (ATP)
MPAAASSRYWIAPVSVDLHLEHKLDEGIANVRVLVIVNPAASRAETGNYELEAWFRESSDPVFFKSSSQEQLGAILSRHGPDSDRIVIGGGDGTISSALPELLKLEKPVAVLPLGTANDFARTLGLPQETLAAAKVALEGRVHWIDVGFVDDRPFLNVASVGVAAGVAKVQTLKRKRSWRMLSYGLGLLRALKGARPFYIGLAIDGAHSWAGMVYQISVGNGRFHGGGLTVAEDAAIDDGKLDLYLVYPGRVLQLLASLIHLRFGLTKPDVLHHLRAFTVALRTRRPKAINVDGELIATTPAIIRVASKALAVIVPNNLPPEHRGISSPQVN